MHNKHILIVHHSGYIGGAGISLFDIIKSLKKLNVKITVICPKEPEEIKNILEDFDINIVTVSNIEIFAHFSGSTNFIFGYRSLSNIIRIKKNLNNLIDSIDAIKPDIIFLNSMTLFYLGKRLQRKGYKTVCFDRETFTNGLFGFRTSYTKYCLKTYFNKVTFISNYDRIESKLPSDKTMVITDKVNCNIEINSKREDNSNNEIKYVLFAGGMVDLKGTHVILKALSYLPKNIRLIFLQYDVKDYKSSIFEIRNLKRFIKIVIGLDYEFKMNRLIKKYALLDRIDFYNTDHDIGKYYSKADVVVFPSTKPHQSRIIYEAGLFRKPIIISDFPNTNEFLMDDFNGLTFKHNDSVDLSKEITKCLSDKKLIVKLINNNFDLTIKNHNLLNMEVEIKALLESIL